MGPGLVSGTVSWFGVAVLRRQLDASNTWVTLASILFGGAIETEGDHSRLDIRIADGGQFVADHSVNGTIVDPGAAGFVPLSMAVSYTHLTLPTSDLV